MPCEMRRRQILCSSFYFAQTYALVCSAASVLLAAWKPSNVMFTAPACTSYHDVRKTSSASGCYNFLEALPRVTGRQSNR